MNIYIGKGNLLRREALSRFFAVSSRDNWLGYRLRNDSSGELQGRQQQLLDD